VSSPKDVQEFLEEHGVRSTLHPVDERGARAQGAAEALGVSLPQIVKSLLFIADGKPVLVLVPGDRRADVQRLKDHLNAQSVRIANRERVEQETGFGVGAVPPVGHARPIPTWLDERLMAHETVYTSAGAKDRLLAIAPTDLLRVSDGQIADITS